MYNNEKKDPFFVKKTAFDVQKSFLNFPRKKTLQFYSLADFSKKTIQKKVKKEGKKRKTKIGKFNRPGTGEKTQIFAFLCLIKVCKML